MKHFIIVSLLIVATLSTFSQSKDSTWLTQFKTLREAIYHRDKEATKQFFTFPIPGNYIWAFAMIDSPTYDSATIRAIKRLESKTTPLTKKLFTQYFDQIFIHELTNSLLKIKTKELLVTGKTLTPVLKADQHMVYTLKAEFSTIYQQLTLTLNIYEKDPPPDQDEFDKRWESVIISFVMIEGHLKFAGLSMAG